MKKILYLILISSFVVLGTLPAYGVVQDVNIVNPIIDVNVVSPPAPSAPTSISISGITDITAQISWTAVTSANQYTVYLDGKAYTGSNNPGASLTGLSPNTSYSVYVVANNAGGDSPRSTIVNFTTLSPVPVNPTSPAVQTSGTTAKLLWQPLAANFNVTQYTIYLDGELATTTQTQTGMQGVNLTNLTEGVHTVAISATNDNREGPQSQPVSFTISTVPSPIGVQYYNKSSEAAWLSWQPVPGSASYNISVNGQFVGETYQPSYVLTELSSDTEYQVSVVTVMPYGEQSKGSDLLLKTEPLAEPVTVNNLLNSIFNYIPDTIIYLEILFAIAAALLISKNLKLIFKR